MSTHHCKALAIGTGGYGAAPVANAKAGVHHFRMLETLRALTAHLRWADERTIAGIRSLPHPDPQALRWMAHVLGSEHMWLARIEGIEPRVAVWPELGVEGCTELARGNHAALDALLASLDEHSLGRVVRYVNSKGETYDSTVGDILIHVAMHGHYHRGQVAAAVRAGGGVPLVTDYIVLRRGDPVT